MCLPHQLSVHSLLAFMEFLYANSISHELILNYVSSIKQAARHFGWELTPFSHHLIQSYLRSITINSTSLPTPRDIFDLSTLASISRACSILEDPILFRAAFLLAFFAFLRMSNVAPHSRYKFDRKRHILRQDVIFQEPGAHILIKWTKTPQDRSAYHFVQIPALQNKILCPVSALQQLLASHPLIPLAPLFAHKSLPFHPVIDTTIKEWSEESFDTYWHSSFRTWLPYLQAFWIYFSI